MKSSVEIEEVSINESTCNLLKDKFDCGFRGEMESKAKGKVKIYFVKKTSFQKANEEY